MILTIFVIGFAMSLDPAFVCAGSCKDVERCNQFCFSKGFKKGGFCDVFTPDNKCCCQ